MKWTRQEAGSEVKKTITGGEKAKFRRELKTWKEEKWFIDCVSRPSVQNPLCSLLARLQRFNTAAAPSAEECAVCAHFRHDYSPSEYGPSMGTLLWACGEVTKRSSQIESISARRDYERSFRCNQRLCNRASWTLDASQKLLYDCSPQCVPSAEMGGM